MIEFKLLIEEKYCYFLIFKFYKNLSLSPLSFTSGITNLFQISNELEISHRSRFLVSFLLFSMISLFIVKVKKSYTLTCASRS